MSKSKLKNLKLFNLYYYQDHSLVHHKIVFVDSLWFQKRMQDVFFHLPIFLILKYIKNNKIKFVNQQILGLLFENLDLEILNISVILSNIKKFQHFQIQTLKVCSNNNRIPNLTLIHLFARKLQLNCLDIFEGLT